MTQEWWAYWVGQVGTAPVFVGWMYLSEFDAQHTQGYLRQGMIGAEPTDPPFAYLINAITGQPVESLVFV